jgi:hypothetical protein
MPPGLCPFMAKEAVERITGMLMPPPDVLAPWANAVLHVKCSNATRYSDCRSYQQPIAVMREAKVIPHFRKREPNHS